MYSFSIRAIGVLVYVLELYLKIFVQGKGTIQPISPFDAAADAKKLHDALTISDNRLNDFANLVTNRSCGQRLEIKKSFEKEYGPLEDFAPEPPEYFDLGYQFVPSCFKCNSTLYAYHVDYTFAPGWSSGVELLEILLYCSQTPELHDHCLSEYKTIYNQDLGLVLDKYLDDDYSHLVMEMIKRKRAAKSPTDQAFIQNTAQGLLDEKGKWEDHRPLLDGALFEISLDVLKQVLGKFQELNENKSLADALDDTTLGYYYRKIYNFIMDPIKFYAEMIDYSITGRSTNEQLLMRVVLITSETNLVDVQQSFEQQYSKPLREALEYRSYLSSMEYKSKLYGFLKYPL